MWKIIGFLPFVLMVQGSSLRPTIGATNSDNGVARVVGGVEAKEGEVPYMASFQVDGRLHLCGGTILNSRWILSAAHCFLLVNDTNIDRISVRVGSVKFNSSGQVYKISEIHKENFSEVSALKDIAMVKTKSDIRFSPNVQPADLPAAGSEVQLGTKLRVSGWGDLRANQDKTPEHLQTAFQTPMTLNKCIAWFKTTGSGGYDDYLNDSQICAYAKKGVGFCQGDSGGPLADGNTIVGIASWNAPCGIGLPDVYTKVSYYRVFIDSFLNK